MFGNGADSREKRTVILDKNFKLGVDYKVQKGATTAVVAGNESKNIGGGGQNRETILLTVNTLGHVKLPSQ